MITDTHAHLDYSEYDPDREEILRRAKESGVTRMVAIGIGKRSIPRTLALADKYKEIYAVVGVHPTDLESLPLDQWHFLEAAAKHPRVVGIGETGLDHYHLTNPETVDDDKARQRQYFIKQLELARTVNKPVVIHCRDAYEDTCEILEEFGGFRKNPGVVHCFSSDERTAKWLFNMDYCISVGGILTFKSSESLRSLVRWMPKDRLLLETDCPYLAPVPHRGERNEPAHTRIVANLVAELWKMPVEKAAEQIQKNVKRVFGI